MEQYGKILLVAMPAFLFLVLFEKWYGWFKNKDTVRNLDMISSLSSGVTNVTKDVLGLSLAVITYPWMVEHLAITHIQSTAVVEDTSTTHYLSTIAMYVVAFFALDFAGYWVHRIQHVNNFFWNGHIVHHSSEEFNLACALRQSISSIVRIFIIFLLPAALLGVPGIVIAVVAPLHLFAQFWYHTQHINKMGFLEKIIVTPSHHRVHHAINPEYIDKNYGQIFIFWDKLFGSYQEELKEVPPVYGITRPVRTWNPIKINFQHVWLLLKDAWHAKSWRDKYRVWIMPTGWRPADVAAKYPVYKIEDVYRFDKYDSKASTALHIWSWVQMVMTLLFISYLFGNIALINKLDNTYIYQYGGFAFLTIYAYTELMDRNQYAIYWEIARAALGLWFIYNQGDWFGASYLLAGIQYIIAGYFVLSILITALLVIKHYKEDKLKSEIETRKSEMIAA